MPRRHAPMLYTTRSRPATLALCVLLVVHARSPVDALRTNAATQSTLPFSVRSGDRTLNELVAEGYTRSITFRRLVDAISATDAAAAIKAIVNRKPREVVSLINPSSNIGQNK